MVNNSRPVAIFPSPKQCTIAARCCPLLFELRQNGPQPIVDLPYRMIIAVATDCDVILYDTQQMAPFAHLQKIHYTRLTDLAWSGDGLILAASSTDGFCTVVTFEQDELGIPYIKEDSDVEESVMDISGCEEFEKETNDENVVKQIVVKPKKPTILDNWTIKTPKKGIGQEVEQSETQKNVTQNTSKDQNETKISDGDTSLQISQNVIVIEDSPNKLPDNTVKVPKRIVPVQIGETSGASKSNDSVASRTAGAKPIAVRRKPRSTQSPTPQKLNPLMSFLKATPERKTNTSNDQKGEQGNKEESVISLKNDTENKETTQKGDVKISTPRKTPKKGLKKNTKEEMNTPSTESLEVANEIEAEMRGE